MNGLLKGQDVYLVGFTAEQRNEIRSLLRNGIRTIHWEGNQAKIDNASSALTDKVDRMDTGLNQGSGLSSVAFPGGKEE